MTKPNLASFKPVIVSDSKKLTEEKTAVILSEINDSMAVIFEKHGLDFTRFIGKMQDSRELTIVARASIIDANKMDSLQRDLLNFCTKLNFKASIMTASVVYKDVEYQVTGLDLSTSETKFRLNSVNNGDEVFMKLDLMKAALPDYFLN